MKRWKLHHICIQTDCYQASVDFYTRLLGFAVLRETPGFHGRAESAWLGLDELLIELQTAKAGETLIPWDSRNAGPVHLAFLVENVEAEHRRLRNLGWQDFKVKDGLEVYRVLDGELCKVRAPEGTEIELRSVTDP
ncbi:MAG: VOC family protein [Pseudoflavonifractor sp.]|nr:VOC family protein [Pseudoflavonifractor sp.]